MTMVGLASLLYISVLPVGAVVLRLSSDYGVLSEL